MDRLTRKSSAWFIFIILFILFAVPIIAATWLYNQETPEAKTTTNFGKLIQPPFSITQFPLMQADGKPLPLIGNKTFLNKWLLILFYPQSCNQFCQQQLYYLGQIQKATGKNSDRIQNVFLTYRNPDLNQRLNLLVTQKYPSMLYWVVNPEKFNQGIAKLSTQVINRDGLILLVDPLGNMVMYYDAASPPGDILEDLEHLLKISQIG